MLSLPFSKILSTCSSCIQEFSFDQNSSSSDQKYVDLHLIVLVSSGSFSPVHKMHIENFELSKTFLETLENHWKPSSSLPKKRVYRVIGGYIAPSSEDYVNGKLGREAIPLSHRNKLCSLVINDHPWIEICDWGWASGWRISERIESQLREQIKLHFPFLFDFPNSTNDSPSKKVQVSSVNFQCLLIHGSDTIKRMNAFKGPVELLCISRDKISNEHVYARCVSQEGFFPLPSLSLMPSEPIITAIDDKKSISSFFLIKNSTSFFYINVNGGEEFSSTNARKEILESLVERKKGFNREKALQFLHETVLNYIESNLEECFPYVNNIPKKEKKKKGKEK